jgi:hypothetical protein
MRVNAGQAVGYGFDTGPGNTHALLWNGVTTPPIDLSEGMTTDYSAAEGTDGVHQVGNVDVGFPGSPTYHAFLWTGTAASGVDLNPSGFTNSYATGVGGGQEVGAADGSATGGNDHAIFWTGTAGSAVDLNPPGISPNAGLSYSSSQAVFTNGVQQVGYAGDSSGVFNDAMLWNGTAASAVDLAPPITMGYWPYSEALATNGTIQVGFAQLNIPEPHVFVNHAMMWFGTADSAIDLDHLLPQNDTWTYSVAESVDANGNVFGYAIDSSQSYYAIEWSPVVPEPAMGSLLLVVGLGMVTRRQRLAH